jgi:spore germination cell wall hydrolase CwlJ-like protein
MGQIFNFLAGIAVTMTVLSSLAVYHLNSEVNDLLDRTAQIEDRVLIVEETPQVVIIEQPKQPARPQLQIHRTNQRVAYKKLDVFCMAKNIFHEAGVEDKLGKYAVAQVTLNRIKNPKYPSTVCDVVMDRKQFSWANDRKIRWTHPKGKTWEESKQIAERVLEDGYRVKGLERANYYHADYVDPFWKKPEAKIAQIGTHIFYARAR